VRGLQVEGLSGTYTSEEALETPANANHHAFGKLLAVKPCPKGLGLFLFALLSEKK